tara:strand:+ start:163251 stop:163562 length:312 start_codon:yes stop_codon:yes gene_type:complete
MKIEIINIKDYEDTNYIYIGRPDKYGNPFSSKDSNIATNVQSKEESLNLFREHLNQNPDLIDDLIKDLKDNKVSKLGCWCFPKKCHGDIYIEKIKERKFKSIL